MCWKFYLIQVTPIFHRKTCIKLSLNSKDSFSSLDLDASLNDIKADLKMPVLFIKICLSIVSTYVILFHMSEEQLFYITILYHPQISVICV